MQRFANAVTFRLALPIFYRMDRHRDLVVWQLAGDLVVQLYRVTRRLPRCERYVSVDQLRRAAWSVQNNIAEGNAKLGRAERRRFFDIALGSLAEIDSMVTTLARIYDVTEDDSDAISDLRKRITAGLFAIIRQPR